MRRDFMFTSESVTEGHPDKLCDQISDAIVDQFLRKDPCARVRAECAISSAILFIAARYSSEAVVDLAHVARKVIQQVGYEGPDFNAKTCSVLAVPQELPPDAQSRFREREIADEEMEKIAVKNQVTVFGFACDQSPSFMPLPIWFAHRLSRQLAAVRRKKTLPYLMPDGKVQVGVEYKNREPCRVHSVTVTASQRRADEPPMKKLQSDILETVIRPVFADSEIKMDRGTRVFVNPDGPLVPGGPSHHSGLTGRKNAVDTYGEYSRHSGDALSGKDPMRIDRVGAYAARYAAKNVVVSGLARECEVTLSYTIGLSRPVSIQVETFRTGTVPDAQITEIVCRNFDFRLAGILKQFNLRYLPSMNPGGFYQKLAAYGHVGRSDMELPWEKTDRASALVSS